LFDETKISKWPLLIGWNSTFGKIIAIVIGSATEHLAMFPQCFFFAMSSSSIESNLEPSEQVGVRKQFSISDQNKTALFFNCSPSCHIIMTHDK
jgi:hypothetical protein